MESADELTTLNSRSTPGEVHVNTLTADYYMALNTRRPPFNNLQARQAINYAANRTADVKIYGGPFLAVPACRSCRRTSRPTSRTAHLRRDRRPSGPARTWPRPRRW